MGKQWKQCQTLFFWAPKSLQMVITAMKLKDTYSGRKVMTNLDRILKSRDITLPTKVCLVKAMVFPVVMYDTFLSCVFKAVDVSFFPTKSNQTPWLDIKIPHRVMLFPIHPDPRRPVPGEPSKSHYLFQTKFTHPSISQVACPLPTMSLISLRSTLVTPPLRT